MAGIGVGTADPNAVPTVSATTPGVSGFENVTMAGSTTVGLYSVTIHNEAATVAMVQGSSLAAGASVSWTASDTLGLPAIAYDPGAGGSLKITTQAYAT